MDALPDFYSRRAIERLRDGLFDSIAMKRLTVEDESIQKKFSEGLSALEKGASDHLCLCGSYGQGKSHTLGHLNQYALSKGYVTSFVQLDLREIPFQQFPVVYHSLMKNLSLPEAEPFTAVWKTWGEHHSLDLLDAMPHRFQMILRAMLCNNSVSSKKKLLKKDKSYKPKEAPHLLEKALMGYDLPVAQLKKILKHQGMEGYQQQSLTCRGNLPYVQMVQALGTLLQEMGYKGLVLFFDEAESITQGRLGQRAKSYDILEHFFQNKKSVYPVFALTDDFFDKVNNEHYDDEKQTFSKNYANAWKDLNVVRLREFSSSAWESLQNRLIQLYSEAYRIDLSNKMTKINEKLRHLREQLNAQETRFKLKALVNQLDVETQHL